MALPLQLEKILAKIENSRNELTRDELHKISKYCDDIIVERFIKGD